MFVEYCCTIRLWDVKSGPHFMSRDSDDDVIYEIVLSSLQSWQS